MPRDGLDLSAVGNAALLSTPELSDEGDVGFVIQIELAVLVVFELRMVDGLLGDSGTTEEPDALDFKRWLLTSDAHSCESMLSEGVEALKETLEEVLGLVHNLTLALVLFVLEEPHGITLAVELLEKLVNCGAGLVGVVHEEGLEVEKVEGRFGKGVQWVLFLLFLLFVVLGLGLHNGLGGNLLLLNLDEGLEGLGGSLDHTVGLHNGVELHNALKPGSGLGCSLTEASVEQSLEGGGQQKGNAEVGNGEVAANEVVTSEGLINVANEVLSSLAGIVEFSLSELSVAEDGVDGGSNGGEDFANHPVAPLVNLSLLDVGAAEQSGAAAGQELGDGNRFVEGTLGGLKERELAGDTLGLDLSEALFRYNDELDMLASLEGDSASEVGQVVVEVVGVDFLRES